jgi:hypothetical protein
VERIHAPGQASHLGGLSTNLLDVVVVVFVVVLVFVVVFVACGLKGPVVVVVVLAVLL